MRHQFTWRGYCGFYVEAGTVADAVQKAIADKPNYIPPGTGLFYGMAGGSNAGAVYIVPLPVEELLKLFPICCEATYENLKADSNRPDNVKDMLDAIEHELTLYAEDQDGCISAKERTQCINFKNIAKR